MDKDYPNIVIFYKELEKKINYKSSLFLPKKNILRQRFYLKTKPDII